MHSHGFSPVWIILSLESTGAAEGSPTLLAGVRFLPGVGPLVFADGTGASERFPAQSTSIRFLSTADLDMHLKVRRTGEGFTTL